jgi:hypothetical protein
MILKQGDLAPKIQSPLTSNGTAVNLTGATVLFRLKRLSGAFVFSKTATIVSPATNGIVEYQLVSGDLAALTPGAYLGEWVVTYADTRVQRFPQGWDLELVVKPAAPAA